MIVDVHAHGLSEDFIVEAAGDPRRGWRVEIASPRQYIAADYGPLILAALQRGGTTFRAYGRETWLSN